MTNNVGAAPDRYVDPAIEYRTFDRLPAVVRRAYWEGVIDWSVRGDVTSLKRKRQAGVALPQAAAELAADLRRCDEREMREFGAALPREFGGASPHERAQATIQPYGPLGPTPPRASRRRGVL